MAFSNRLPSSVSGEQARITASIKKALGSQIVTIDDLYAATYGVGFENGMMRKDSQTTTSTSNARNIIYGAGLGILINTGANTAGALAQRPWQKSGIRVVDVAGSTGSLGQSEGGAIPVTAQESVEVLESNPKVLAAAFDMSDTQQMLEGKDDVWTWAERQSYQREEFMNRLNRGLNTNVTTLASTNVESIDRLVSSYAEVTNCGDVDANDSDWGGQDRDAGATAFDAYVDHNSNTDRTFALTQMDTVLQNIRPYWNGRSPANKFIITGDDTELRISQLIQSQIRYDVANPSVQTQMGVNGVQTLSGVDAGIDTATFHKIPIIPDANAVQDTLSRVTFLDGDHVWMSVLQPVTYLETDDIILQNKFAREGVYYGQMDLMADKFKGLGKVRDTK